MHHLCVRFRLRHLRPRFALCFTLFITLLLALLIAACGPAATPEVIRDFSRANTLTALARPSATPTGPTPTPSLTSTPYTRPTDAPSLDLSLPVVRVGEETITLGQFRARVRYERFAALDEARRLIEQVGLANLNFNTPGPNPALDRLAGVFNTLANSRGFGFQVYDILVRESIIRQEYRARGLTLDPAEVSDYWIRRFGLQREADRDKALEELLNTYIALAERYSGLSRAQVMQVAESFVMASQLAPMIAKENVTAPEVITYRLKRIVARTREDAEAALAAIRGGESFRAAACRYSTLPGTRGTGGDLGFVTRRSLVAGLQDARRVFEAEPGALVGPLQSPVGWYVFRVNEKRRNADGDTEVRAQAIVVAAERLAHEILKRAQAGEDFSALACLYTLDRADSDGGDVGWIGASKLPLALAALLQSSTDNGLFGPVETPEGFEVVLVEERRVEIPRPGDVEQANERAFRQWQAARVGSSYVQPLSDGWRDAIPEDPLPRQVAPFMREENFGLPTPAPTMTATP